MLLPGDVFFIVQIANQMFSNRIILKVKQWIHFTDITLCKYDLKFDDIQWTELIQLIWDSDLSLTNGPVEFGPLAFRPNVFANWLTWLLFVLVLPPPLTPPISGLISIGFGMIWFEFCGCCCYTEMELKGETKNQ